MTRPLLSEVGRTDRINHGRVRHVGPEHALAEAHRAVADGHAADAAQTLLVAP